MSNPTRPPYVGPALFSYGFRPLFLLAGCFAALVVPLWMLVWSGEVALSGPFSPLDWHIHEMLFGYTSAVIAGFMFTAIPNWTGRMPTRGWPLMALAALWLAGRLAVAGVAGLGPLAVLVIDCAFMLAIGAMVATEIIAGRNWGNLKVVVPVLVYLAANLTFHLEVLATGIADYGRRLGFAMVVMLILLIGGRIIPSFTRNWLTKRGPNPGPLPAPFNRFDGASLLVTLLALLLWVAQPELPLTGAALLLAALIQTLRLARWSGWRVWSDPLVLMLHLAFAYMPAGLAALLVWVAQPESALTGAALLHAAAIQTLRLARWRGWRVWSDPLVLMLHLAFAFMPLGLAALGLASLGLLEPATGFHLLGIGGFGGMTLAVMMRAALGHTGRQLRAGPAVTLAFAAVALAALARVLIPAPTGLWVAAALWTLGFCLFVLRYAPVLTRANPARRQAYGPSGSSPA